MVSLIAVGVALQATTALGAAVGALNFSGLWFNAPADSESGWGINFAHQGDVIFATWFTYDTSGKAWWLSMTANKTADGIYAGTLVRTTGPSVGAVPFDPSTVTSAAVGNGTVTFSDANTGTFTYTVNGLNQTKNLTRQIFGPLPVCGTAASSADLIRATNYQDLWWAPNGAEAGWGVNFTHQGDDIFATWFTYDATGAPLWLSASLQRADAGPYNGTLILTGGPAFDAVPFNPSNVTRTSVGTLSVNFQDGNNATFSYSLMLPGRVPINQSKAITRQVFRSPGTVCSNPVVTSGSTLLLTAGNARATAAEAMQFSGSLDNVAATSGSTSAAPAAAEDRPVLVRRIAEATKRAMALGNAFPTAATFTVPCTGGGTISLTGTPLDPTSTVTFGNCVEAGATLNGSFTYNNTTYSISGTSEHISTDVTMNNLVGIFTGGAQYTWNGTMHLDVTGQTTGGGFTGTYSAGSFVVSERIGSFTDTATMTAMHLTLGTDTTVSPPRPTALYDYSLSSAALRATYVVHALQPFETDVAALRQHPYTGQMVVTGSNNTRLLITVFGDETYIPQSGMDQVELQLDTGSGAYGAPIWVSWNGLNSALITLGEPQ